jgi:hypothetical protein
VTASPDAEARDADAEQRCGAGHEADRCQQPGVEQVLVDERAS